MSFAARWSLLWFALRRFVGRPAFPPVASYAVVVRLADPDGTVRLALCESEEHPFAMVLCYFRPTEAAVLGARLREAAAGEGIFEPYERPHEAS